MFASSRGRILDRATASSCAVALPGFLVPAFHPHTLAKAALVSIATRRQFSATSNRSSKLGRTPISIPPGVELSIGEAKTKKDATTYLKISKRTVTVSGPLGKLDLDVPPFLHIDLDPTTRKAMLSVEDTSVKHQREMWGTTWAYLNKYILGVSEGHTAVLRLVGIGYRASIESRPEKEEYPGQQFIILKLGFSHTVDMGVPRGIKASVPQPTRILLEGINKEEIMSFAASMRKWRKPEPYKGKGIFINDETIKLKQKKIK
ncbi:hypothetical protein VTK73DRAFT_5387 [Phialemonium thermophilum]|uniref:Large ribosomal subunit protein uL6 alpha-beta domain-containing protein n=1 Tax=Phialemonium thermophilum TaxID=223376 RepID=A0ABR3XY66_9PEZI